MERIGELLREKPKYTFNKHKVISILKEMGYADPKHEIDWGSYSPDVPIEDFLLTNYKIVLKGLKDKVEDSKAALLMQQAEHQKELDKQKEELLNKIDEQTLKSIVHIKKNDIFSSLIKVMLMSSNIHFTIGCGAAGLGKSFTAISTLKEQNIKYVTLNSKVTPLSLYKFLYDNKDRVILFDDLIGILDNDIALSILMSCLFSVDNIRKVQYHTTSKIFQDLDIPDLFEFKGKILLLTNQFKHSEFISALKDRGFYYDFDYTYMEKIQFMEELIKLETEGLSIEQKTELLNEIKSLSCPATEDFSLRLLLKGYCLMLHSSEWKELLKSLIKNDERYLFVWNSIVAEREHKQKGLSYSVDDDIILFYEKGFGSRANFFRIKKALRNEYQSINKNNNG